MSNDGEPTPPPGSAASPGPVEVPLTSREEALSPSGTSPTADASVRVAWAADAEAIAGVQARAWRTAYADILPAELREAADERAFAEQWRHSLSKPTDARQRVLVALDRDHVVGFAATGPSEDPDSDSGNDGAIEAFHIDPSAVGSGHGSRLINACVDTLRADGFARAVIWVFSADDALRTFLTQAGWGADGAYRELDLHGDGSVRAKQVRLHCSIVEEEGSPGAEGSPVRA